MIPYDSLYGNYRTRKFTDIFPSFNVFEEEFMATPFTDIISNNSLNITYYLLYSEFGNSHIANSDENQFKYKLFAIIYMTAPTWEKRLEIQKRLRELSENELTLGSKQIFNHAFNPGSAPSTSSLEELNTINEQNTTHSRKSKMEGYATLLDLLKLDVTRVYLDEFKRLFIKIVEPQEPLWYRTEESED